MTENSHINSPMMLGGVKLQNRLLQAPLAGISVRAFRLQARRFGAGLAATEMVSAYGIHYRNRRTLEMLRLTPAEHPVAVQLFGNRPEIMAEAAREAEAAGADIIDINMGCPVRKVVKTGAGVALMEDEDLAARIVEAMVAATSVPVTAKIRSGADGRVTAPSLAPKLEAAGAAAVCIHPRLGSQGQKGSADHAVTAGLVERLGLPVFASGDVCGPADVRRLLEEMGCAAVMVGRATLGNPWLFSDLLAGRECRRRSLGELVSEMSCFHDDLAAEMGSERAGRFMRKFYGWYLRPFRPGAELRDGLRRAGDFSEARRLLESQSPEFSA